MVSVIIPTLNEEKTISKVISFCLESTLVKEVIVIDDGSVDNTVSLAIKANAKVYYSSMRGKGVSMHDGLLKAGESIVVYLDGDIFDFAPNLIDLIVAPFLEGDCDFVKGKFQRKAGRVTILTAKPLLRAFFPKLAQFEQPLGGIIAAKKELLMKLDFESDYGVDIGLLIDAHKLEARIKEVNIGYIDHDQQPLECLGQMSNQVVRTILNRANKYNKLNNNHIQDSYELQRIRDLDVQIVCEAIDTNKMLALFDMDGTIIDGRFIEELARKSGKDSELKQFLDNKKLSDIKRTKSIAKILKGINKSVFEEVAQTIPLIPGAQETIIELKKKGYCIGIITDSFFIASEIIKKRVFADFSVANLIDFQKGICTGNIRISPFFISEEFGCQIHKICKLNFLKYIQYYLGFKIKDVRYIGDGNNDICILRDTENSIAINPKSIEVSRAAKNQVSYLSNVIKIWS